MRIWSSANACDFTSWRCHGTKGSSVGGDSGWPPVGIKKLDWTAHRILIHFDIGLQIAAKPLLFLYSPFLVPDVWSQMQHFPANAVQVDKTVAELESLKKLLIIWLMCIRLWECEINHQPWDELLKWILVFCLLSLGNGFSFLHHQVNRCRDAVFSFSQSQ